MDTTFVTSLATNLESDNIKARPTHKFPVLHGSVCQGKHGRFWICIHVFQAQRIR